MLPEYLRTKAQADEEPFKRGLGLWADERLTKEAHDDTGLLGLLVAREKIYMNSPYEDDRGAKLLAHVYDRIRDRKQELGITDDPGQ